MEGISEQPSESKQAKSSGAAASRRQSIRCKAARLTLAVSEVSLFCYGRRYAQWLKGTAAGSSSTASAGRCALYLVSALESARATVTKSTLFDCISKHVTGMW